MPLRWSEAAAKRFLALPKERKPRKPVPLVATGYPCTQPVHLVLPYPVLNNRYYRHVQGHTILSAEARAYHKAVAEVIRVEWPVGIPKPLNTLLFLTVILHVPSRRHRPDADAGLKAPFDAMTYAGVYLDDKQVRDFNFRQREPRPPFGCVEIIIEPWKDGLSDTPA